MSTPDSKAHAERPFSLVLFVVINVLSLAFLLGLLWFVAPSVWNVQISASWQVVLVTTLGAHLVNAFFEWFFHRYVLHAPVFPFLRRFYSQHTLHHQLTHVRQKTCKESVGKKVVVNCYPILEEEQHEASFFPWYSLIVFALVMTPLFAYVQFLLPQRPIFLGGLLGLALSMGLYEILHMIEHWSFDEWWLPRIKNSTWGWFWKKAYIFHLRHHADIKCNEAISGFFGFPIADLVFGTWVSPSTLYEHGSSAIPQEFEPPKPRFFIVWLDSLAKSIVRRYH